MGERRGKYEEWTGPFGKAELAAMEREPARHMLPAYAYTPLCPDPRYRTAKGVREAEREYKENEQKNPVKQAEKRIVPLKNLDY